MMVQSFLYINCLTMQGPLLPHKDLMAVLNSYHKQPVIHFGR